ncbi:hypothetical protein [Actinopolymorpha alba]|uniref:hypothetical protein n=1 Tax=Actinopolymorpha alba TaxID=533267 RepID=UPI0012F6A798|nr:hypothetical protein [Actinopolymorpha alba]
MLFDRLHPSQLTALIDIADSLEPGWASQILATMDDNPGVTHGQQIEDDACPKDRHAAAERSGRG